MSSSTDPAFELGRSHRVFDALRDLERCSNCP